MKSKISVNIDSELLNIIKDCSDSDLDSIIQDAVAQFLGVKQIWVRTDSLDPILVPTPVKTVDAHIGNIVRVGNTVHVEHTVDAHADNTVHADTDETHIQNADDTQIIKRRRRPKFVLKVWDKIKQELGIEFTIDDYWNATKKCGLNYKDSARHSTILEHIKLIEETGNIVRIREKPRTYRKLEIGLKANEGKEELEQEVKSEAQEGKLEQDKGVVLA